VGSLLFGSIAATTVTFLLLRRRIARTEREHTQDVQDQPSRFNLGRRAEPQATITPFNDTSPTSTISSTNRLLTPRENVPGGSVADGYSRPISSGYNEKTGLRVTTNEILHDDAMTETRRDASPFTSNLPVAERQRLLEEEVNRMRLQILGMVNQALSSGEAAHQGNGVDVRSENRQMAAEMDRMRAQIEMLEAQQNSEWARGLTDEPPSYFTSIMPQQR